MVKCDGFMIGIRELLSISIPNKDVHGCIMKFHHHVHAVHTHSSKHKMNIRFMFKNCADEECMHAIT